MPKVLALDELVIRQIAAGEVVERPASVVKELIENSIDAGATRITLEIEGSGRELIRVTDDGCGMAPEDAELALERHTTSKIRSAEDLEKLFTFGFRGEALPSIGSISRMALITRSGERELGVALEIEAGRVVSKKECGRAAGTTIEVRDLFFNTPARLKFLKADATEKGKILSAFEEVAIAHPGLFLELRSGPVTAKSSRVEWPARAELIDRIGDVWGRNFSAQNLFPIDFQHPLLQITGWVSKPDAHQATKATQLFYVNRRPVFSKILTHALYEAFRDCLPVGRHPAAAIFVTLDPAQVDVNVHPSKREVRFRNESQIHQALVQEIRRKRAQGSEAPAVFGDAQPYRAPQLNAPIVAPSIEPSTFTVTMPPVAFEHPAQATRFVDRPLAGAPRSQAPLIERDAPRPLCQFSRLYIVAEQGGNLMLIDQHAASERVFYERFRAALLEEKPIDAQPLLIPLLWNLTASQAEAVRGRIETFRKLGFAIEAFGETTFRVSECPASLPETDLKDALDGILGSLESAGSSPLPAEERMLMMAACRAAVKANDPLSPPEQAQLLKEWGDCANPHTCPHGRPVALTLTRAELDKKFGRT